MLVLFISGIFLWYFNIFKKNALVEKEYPFLSSFTGGDQEIFYKEYGGEGLIYNIHINEEQNTFSFDMNIFKDNSYVENISLPLDKAKFDLQTVREREIIPVSILLKLPRESVFENFKLNEFYIQKLEISKDNVLNILKEMYPTITGENLVVRDDYKGIPFRIIKFEGGDRFSFETIGYNLESLLRPWIESRIYMSTLNQEFLKDYSSKNILSYLQQVEKYKTSILDKESKGDNSKMKAVPFSCSLASDISASGLIDNDTTKYLTDNYCSTAILEQKKIDFLSKYKPEYSKEDLVQSINKERLQEEQIITKDPLDEWNLSILKDLKSLSAEETDKTYSVISTNLLSNSAITLGHMCKLVYKSPINDPLRDQLKSVLQYSYKHSLMLIDKDLFEYIWCANEYKQDEDFNDLTDSFILKMIKTKYHNNMSVYGVWENNKYKLDGNTFFFNLLLNKHENL